MIKSKCELTKKKKYDNLSLNTFCQQQNILKTHEE